MSDKKKGDKKAEMVVDQPKKKDLLREVGTYQSILDLVPVMCWYKDTANRTLFANKAALAFDQNSKPAEHETDVPVELSEGVVPAVVDEAFATEVMTMVASGSSQRGLIESYPSAETGQVRWIKTDKFPYYNQEGHLVGIVVIATDITDLHQAEEALEQSRHQYTHLHNQMAAVLHNNTN